MAKDIVIGTKVDLKGLKKGEKDIDTSVDKMSDKFSGGKGGIDAFGSSLTAVAGASAILLTAITGLTVGVAKYTATQVEASREIGRIADNANLARESVAGVASSFISAGEDVEMASDFIQDFTERLGDARSGSMSLRESFNELGVDISGSTEQALRKTIDTLGTMEDRERALFRGIELFGDTYKTVAQEISSGSDLLENSIFSPSLIENSEKLKLNMEDIKTTFQSTANTAIEPLVESLADLSAWFLDSSAIVSFTDYLEDVGTVAGWVKEKLDEAFPTTAVGKMEKAIRLQREMLKYAEDRIDVAQSANSREEWEFRAQVERESIASLERELVLLRELANVEPPERNGSAVITNIDSQTSSYQKQFNALDRIMALNERRFAMEALGNRQLAETLENAETTYNDMLLESHQNRKEQRTNARDEELEMARTIAGEKERIIFEGAQFAFDIGNTFFEMSMERDRRELSQWESNQRRKNGSLIVTARRRKQLEDQTAKETEVRESELAKKQGAMQISNAWADSASGVVGIWSSLLGNPMIPKSVAVGLATGYSSMMTGIAGANTAKIASSMQGFANGGVVQQESGVPSTGDMHTVRVNPNEEILTEDDPRHINNGGGGGNFTIHIGTLTQDTLSELEDNIRALQSAGRTSIDLVS